MGKHRQSTSFAGNLLLLAISMVVALVLAEVAFRIAMQVQWSAKTAQWKHPLYELLPENPIEYRLKANVSRENTIKKTGEKWSYTINSRGYRDDEFDLSADTSRILFLGDSYTFGWAVEQNETFPHHVEQWFSENRRDLAVDALNLGVPGYNTEIEYHHLQQNIDELAPDMVVLVYVMNDGEPQRNHHQRPGVRYRYVSSWLAAFVKEQINFYLFNEEERLQTGLNLSSGDYLKALENNEPKWAAGRRAFAEMAALCRTKGVPLLVLIFPDVSFHLDHRYSNGPIHAAVQRWGAEDGVMVIDLYNILGNKNYQDYSVDGDGHPNSRAFKEVAAVISPVIAKILDKD